MNKEKIKTYNTEDFRARFMQPDQKLADILKADFGRFFITKVEDMLQLIKLPVPPTRSTTHSFIYLTEGVALMRIGSETYKIHQGECLVVSAGQVFSFDNLDENKGYICKFHNDFIIGKFGRTDLLKSFDFLNSWGNPYITFDPQVSMYVHQLLVRMFADYSANGLTHIDIIQSYLIALLCEVNNAYTPFLSTNKGQAVKLTNMFKALLVSNVRTKHLVTDYADLLHITANHLNKSVKQVTGKSPTKWIDEALVLEAKVLLHQTDFSIGEIAEEIGIDDPSYFSRLFKKYVGVTPLAFRKMIELS